MWAPQNHVIFDMRHGQFPGINQSFFYRTFIPCWRLIYWNQQSWSGWISVDIGEMSIHLHFQEYSCATTRIIFYRDPNGHKYLSQTVSRCCPIPKSGKVIFGHLKSFGKKWRKSILQFCNFRVQGDTAWPISWDGTSQSTLFFLLLLYLV
jgi:hypothetical protein